ncbi:MAG TPA: UDP-N-acetylmuramoyl-L-alanyl-D-glutamate--2,6-diaminopimelate ligase [bacterium]|nr:UDP-N-acetylmuramoyl-L-alanyl-D-glutamate--2,6-diaminopimelate ligase [bacterium]
MMYKIKQLLKKILPKWVMRLYHWKLAVLANLLYGFPSDKMIIIGVTGTNGKSSTVEMIARLIEASGYKVGFTSTVKIKIADKEFLNKSKMTMLGRFALQKLLKQMVKAGCQYAVVETSSQGLDQFRHLGINYDVAVFTNLTPEHIEAHGGFENYKKAKGRLFEHLNKKNRKDLFGRIWEKCSVVNVADEHAAYYLSFKADKKYGFALDKIYDAALTEQLNRLLLCERYELSLQGAKFWLKDEEYQIPLLGKFNIKNALCALAVAKYLQLDELKVKKALAELPIIPGRMELINEGQNFTVLVDYAPEPASFEQLYQTIKLLPHNKIIHVFGSCGGGRDVARRPILGRMAGEWADYCIVTNEDPYDDDPQEIIDQVAAGCLEKGKMLNENLFKILNRREAIKKAMSLAQAGDLVVMTGKGAEQAIMLANGTREDWDEREEARKILNRLD